MAVCLIGVFLSWRVAGSVVLFPSCGFWLVAAGAVEVVFKSVRLPSALPVGLAFWSDQMVEPTASDGNLRQTQAPQPIPPSAFAANPSVPPQMPATSAEVAVTPPRHYGGIGRLTYLGIILLLNMLTYLIADTLTSLLSGHCFEIMTQGKDFQ
jgi:hypothetical protein